jgi:EAL and modified HD-GYP domain-containing signal transduction protein
MEIYIATQPIFNCEMDVYAYEVLYRNSEENKFSHKKDYMAKCFDF